MPVDTEQWHAEIGNFNGCLNYAIVKLEISLFNFIIRVSQVFALILAIISSVPIKSSQFTNCESFLDFPESFFENILKIAYIKNCEQFFLLLKVSCYHKYLLSDLQRIAFNNTPYKLPKN